MDLPLFAIQPQHVVMAKSLALNNLRVTVRPAVESDSPGILRCLHNAFAPYEQLYSPAAFLDTTLTAATVKERLAAMSVFVALTDADQIVGTLTGFQYSGQEGHLRGMAVRSKWQGTGVADLLLCTVEDHLRARGYVRRPA